MDLLTALGQLDSLDDTQWTASGAPRLNTLIDLTEDMTLTRKKITQIAPLFNRENTTLPVSEETSQDPLLDDAAEKPVKYDDNSPDHLRLRLASFADILEDANGDVKKAQDHLLALQRESDKLRDKLNILEPNPSNQEAINDYLASQNRNRAQRFARRNTILQGLTIKDIQSRSQLDEAMARKNLRGQTRPTQQG